MTTSPSIHLHTPHRVEAIMDRLGAVQETTHSAPGHQNKSRLTNRAERGWAPLVAGGAGGLVSTTALLPLDVIRVRLAVYESSGDKAMNVVRVARGIMRHEGIRGLYHGWAPAVLGSAISWGGFFAIYEHLKRRLMAHKTATGSVGTTGRSAVVLNGFDHFILSCTSGGIMVGLTNPIWLIKTRMQLQMKLKSPSSSSSTLHIKKPYNNMWDAFRTIISEEGATALYKGAGPALLLTSHGGVQFVIYESLKRRYHVQRIARKATRHKSLRRKLELSIETLTMGAAAKIIASTVTYPLQVIKARMQQRSECLELTHDGNVRVVRREYNGLLPTARRMWLEGGLRVFFQGCLPNALRVAPGAAITFVTYEVVMDCLAQ